jgi:hypothetical protein
MIMNGKWDREWRRIREHHGKKGNLVEGEEQW